MTVIIGRKGFGKSTKARELVESEPRRIIFDPMREYTDGVVVRSFEEAVEYLDRVRDRDYSVILRTLDPEDELRLIELAVHGEPESPLLPGVMLYVDEADRLCSPHRLPHGLFRAVNYGRHFGVSMIFVSRRPRRLHRDMTANADRIFVGKTQEPADLDYLAEFITRELSERAKAIESPGEFIVFPDDIGAALPAPVLDEEGEEEDDGPPGEETE